MAKQSHRPSAATTLNAMRTIVTRIALPFLLALSFGLVQAAGPAAEANGINGVNDPSMEQAVMDQIIRFIRFAVLVGGVPMYGVVEVAFVVNTEGRLVIRAADSENQDLCDYVVRKLARIHVGPNPSGQWNTSHVRFTFRPEV
jgi:hypothetical protein